MNPSTFCILILIAGKLGTAKEKVSSDKVQTALEYVERVRNSPCTGGTEETLPVAFDTSIWLKYSDVAIRMSNVLTKLLIRNNNSFSSEQEQFLFDMVRNNVDGKSLIFGSAIAVEEYVFPKYRIFCPYAYRKDRVYAHDISLNYNYLDPSTEWYAVLRNTNWSNTHVSENKVTYRRNTTSHDNERSLRQPMARQEDGHWTYPYYDCGGGDIWMVTYSAPIFGWNDDTNQAIFRGIGTIDIELTNIDINQCDADMFPQENDEEVKSVDVFQGTHRCPASTRCVPEHGRGFIPGTYKCVCKDGFYFPDIKADKKYFNGSIIEKQAEQNKTSDLSEFQCLRCAEGCDTCVDPSPCLYSLNILVRVILCLLSFLCFCIPLAASVIVFVFKNRRAIKSASPIFLHIMNAGGAMMCLTMFITVVEPDDYGIICNLKNWPQHIGFAFAYGALLIKTWRISAIFKVKSAKKLNLTDRILLSRFAPIPLVSGMYLIAWTALGTSEVEWRVMDNTLKYKDCSIGWWNYGAFLGEALFLLWGAVLCFIVRKAPSLFNESKYITWAIYNNIILGSFILIIRQLIIIDLGPDVLYIVDFVYIQVSVTIMMCLVYVPKLIVLYHREEDVAESITGRGVGTSKQGQPNSMDTVTSKLPVNKICQTDISGDIVKKDKLKQKTTQSIGGGPTEVSVT